MGDGLLAAFDLAAFAAGPALRGAPLIATHLALHVLACAGAIWTLLWGPSSDPSLLIRLNNHR
jgi:hypothetical protein